MAQETLFAAGHIVALEPDRFRLETGQGQGLVLALSRPVRTRLRDLSDWQAAEARVIVLYSGRVMRKGGVAHWVGRWR